MHVDQSDHPVGVAGTGRREQLGRDRADDFHVFVQDRCRIDQHVRTAGGWIHVTRSVDVSIGERR